MRKCAAMVLLAACGGMEKGSHMVGSWTGHASTNVDATFSAAPIASASVISIHEVSSTQVRLSGFCPDGSGSVDLQIQGDSAVAHTLAVCSSATLGSCAQTQLLLSFVNADLLPDGTLRSLAAGWAIGCGAAGPISILITAQRGS